MADPLVTGVRTARTVEKSDTERTYEERLARGTSGGRFERTQSVEARAFDRARTKKTISEGDARGTLAQKRQASSGSRASLTTKRVPTVEEKVKSLLRTAHQASRLKEFTSLVPKIIWVDALVIPFSTIGLLLLLFSDTTSGAVVSFIVSAVTFGATDLKLVGLLFICLSVGIAFVSYIGMLIYLLFRYNIKITNFTGWYYIGAVAIPVAGVVPGLNIIMLWFTLWTYILLKAPEPSQ